MPLRLVFMGTPEFSVPTLDAVSHAGHEVAAVYTQPPRPAGRRGLAETPSPVHRAADRLGLPVRTPPTLKDAQVQAEFAALAADIAVVVAYGLILPVPVLEATSHGALNGHASLLPRWRGAAPIQRAVMAGDAETGLMIMRMERGLDTGPVALSRRVAIGAETTAGDLHDRLAAIGAELMVEALSRLERGTLTFTPQAQEGVTYAEKIGRAETRIDWTAEAVAVDRRIRGLSPSPGAWCEMTGPGGTERLKLLRSVLAEGAGTPGTILDEAPTIACGNGAVRLLEVQRAGAKPVSGADFMKGARLGRGGTLA